MMLRLLIVVLSISTAVAIRGEARAYEARCEGYRDTTGARQLKTSKSDGSDMPDCPGPTDETWFNFKAKISEISSE